MTAVGQGTNPLTRESAARKIALAAPACPRTRGFLPWRLSDAGPSANPAVAMGRHLKPFTGAVLATRPSEGPFTARIRTKSVHRENGKDVPEPEQDKD
jgi:hypothetical protein